MIDAAAVRAWAEDPFGLVSRDMRRRAQQVQADAVRRAPVDTGRLRRSIHVTGPYRGQFGPAWDVAAHVNYARWVHDGRGPGRMPPPAALRAWARRHGMAGAEFLIARAIGRRGVSGRPFLADALRQALR